MNREALRYRLNLGPNAWLVAYDIANPGRLGRIHRHVKKSAMPLQYSVYLGWLSASQFEWLVDGLHDRIDERADDVRLYHLPATTEVIRLGRQWLPSGVHMYQNGFQFTEFAERFE